MRTIIKAFYLVPVFIGFTAVTYAQNVGINTTGATPNPTSGLDIDFTDKGLLIPRVSLSSLTTYNPPITGGSPTTSMLVYNTNNAIGEGFYYWDGSSWVKFIANSPNSDAWLRTGNAGTNPATNFIGTTDNQALAFRTNDTVRMTIASNGNVGIGTANPLEQLHVSGGNVVIANTTQNNFSQNRTSQVLYLDNIRAWSDNGVRLYDGNSNAHMLLSVGTTGRIQVFSPQSLSPGQLGTSGLEYADNTNLSDLVLNPLGGNVGIGTSNPSNRLHIEAASNPLRLGGLQTDNTLSEILVVDATGVIRRRSASSLVGSTGWSLLGNSGTNPGTNFIGTTDNQALGFRTNNIERMRIASTGNVGIGTATPNSRFTVVGNSLFGVNNAASIGAVQITTGGASPISNRLTYGTDGTGWKFAIGKNQGGTVTDQLTIQDNGNVGIGTTSPIDRLQVTGGNVRVGEINPTNTGTFPNYGRFLYFSGGPAGGVEDSDNSDALWIARYNSASDVSELRVNISDENYTNDAFVVGYTAHPTNIWYPILRVRDDGRVGIGTNNPGGQFELSLDQGRKPGTNTWTVPSDERLKDIHGPYSKGLNEILKLNPVTYNYKNVGERTFAPEVLKTTAVGFSAQEVQKVFPETVGVDDDGYLNFNMHAILVAYVNAIKEQQAIIEAQKMEIELLKQNSTELKAEIDFIKSQLRADMQTSNR